MKEIVIKIEKWNKKWKDKNKKISVKNRNINLKKRKRVKRLSVFP